MSFISKLINKKCILFTELLTQKNITRNYVFKSDLKIKWIRPEKISCIKPQKSGDLQPAPQYDKKQYILDARNSKELENADDVVKRLFTLEFNYKKATNDLYKTEMIDKVKQHRFDLKSIETRIARWTSTIRAMQAIMDSSPKENTRMKVVLKELIDKRKKNLKHLRRWDYKRFEWLLENLDIVYKPHPTSHHVPSRKESLTKLTDIYCDDIKQNRLNEYRMKLESQKIPFLEEKIRTLEFIRDEEKECGVDITVSQDQIDVIKQQLEELKLKNVKHS